MDLLETFLKDEDDSFYASINPIEIWIPGCGNESSCIPQLCQRTSIHQFHLTLRIHSLISICSYVLSYLFVFFQYEKREEDQIKIDEKIIKLA